MKKRAVAMTMAAIMACSILAGCGGKEKENSNAETQTAEDGSIELSIWVHETDSDEGKLYKSLVDDFNEEYAGKYHATLTQIARSGDAGGYDDKVNAAISNGGLPDGVTVAEYADAEAIVPLGEYFKEDELSDFNPSIIQQGTYKDELYALGTFDSSVGLFYNKDMFEEADITPATKEDPWTLDDLTEAAKKLTKDDCYGLTMSLGSTDETLIYFFLPLIQSQGSNVIDKDGVKADGYLNGEAAVNTLTWIKKMVDEGYVSATPADNCFPLEQCAMAITGSWEPANLAKYDINWGLMPMAKYDENSEAVSACGSWTFAMSSDCADDRKEGAAELIRFMTSADAGAQMYEANSMPPARQSAFDELDVFKEAPLDVFQYQLANTSQARPVSVNYAVLSNQFATAVQNVLTGQDPKEALDEAVTQFNFQTDTE